MPNWDGKGYYRFALAERTGAPCWPPYRNSAPKPTHLVREHRRRFRAGKASASVGISMRWHLRTDCPWDLLLDMRASLRGYRTDDREAGRPGGLSAP